MSSIGSAQTSMVVKKVANIGNPIFATTAPGDSSRLFVVQQGSNSSHVSTIRIIDLTTRTLKPAPFLSIPNVLCCNELGLLGLAFHPNYQENGLFYVNFTAEDSEHPAVTTIREYQRKTADLADHDSGRTILTIPQPGLKHNGGWMGFSPKDNYLYIATGDGQVQANAQDITSNLLGKILRIDPCGTNSANGQYGIPGTNPFVGQEGDDEIWAYGLRNPWRASFDRSTGDFYIGDVGAQTYEEINVQAATSQGGINYGWNVREGASGDSLEGAIDPVYHYRHGFGADQGFAVIGGYVYRGPIESLQGSYFFADNRNHRLWSMKWDRSQATANNATNFSRFVDWTSHITTDEGNLVGVTSFGEDEEGNLYLTSRSQNAVFMVEAATVDTAFPSEIEVLQGIQKKGKLNDAYASDDKHLIYSPDLPLSSHTANTRILCKGTIANPNPSYLELVVESNANTVGLNTRIDLYNWATQDFDRVDQRATTFENDTVTRVVVSENVADYIRPTDQFIRARIDWRIKDAVLLFPWEIRLDQAVWHTD